jgi:hypothetical protein
LANVGGLLSCIVAINLVVMQFFSGILLELDIISDLFFNSLDYSDMMAPKASEK